MRKLLLALAATIATGSVAAAADIPRAPVRAPAPALVAYNWTGIYIGLNGGLGWGTTRGNLAPGAGIGNFDVSGGLFGGQIGLNYQVQNFVWGLEADWQWANIDGSATAAGITATSKVTSFGTLRGRLGIAFDRALFYGTGGFAWGKNEITATGVGTSSNTHTGWTAGAGLEYGFTPNWSGKIEYLYVRLSDKDYFSPAVCGAACSAGVGFNVIRAGLNYRFNW